VSISKKQIGQELLCHLELYRELGVRVGSNSSSPKIRRPKNAKQEPQATAKPEARETTAAESEVKGIAVVPSMFDAPAFSNESLEEIRAELGDCQRCKLAPMRHLIVFGAGNPKAELMFVGEAPGSDEDQQGLPFVGRAGQLLTKIIQAMGMAREEVYICNILKCRPPENRNPEPDEIALCEPFLFRQIAAVKPRVICALGAFGAQTLLRTKEAISRLRGNFYDFRGAQLMATYHPAYLLRNPNEKRKVWEDVQKIRDYLLRVRALKS
jgi:uracil-DNA glycosylase family 4